MEVHDFASICVALALAAKFVQTRRRLLASRTEMARIKETLEKRVRDRTRQLVKSNLDLQREALERRAVQNEMSRARTQAEQASQTKSEFLANMSHEIRTPMTAILGFCERLEDAALEDEDQRDAVTTIRRNGEHLLQIIGDILDLSKIEAGKLVVEQAPCDPVAETRAIRDLLSVRAESAGLQLEVDFRGELPRTIRTDATRLRQILMNLVGNALKFTGRGKVRIVCEEVELDWHRTDDAGNELSGRKPFLRWSVIDTGVGMSLDETQRLFRPFTQLDGSATRVHGGTGLGLSICRSLVGMLGGTIEVSSEPGRGSRFTFTVDPGSLREVDRCVPETVEVEEPRKDRRRRGDESLPSGTRLLLAEDGRDNQRLLSYLLGRAGAHVDLVSNGEEALERALYPEGGAYDVVLMDVQMPVMDGMTAVRELRAAGYKRPIVALSAHTMASDRERCLIAGCDEFCSKPVDRSRLIALLADEIRRARALETRALMESAVRHRTRDGMEDFDWEDDPALQELVQLFVHDLAGDLERLEEASANGELERIAVIAHQIKGCAGGYGFSDLGDEAAKLEQLARDDQDSSEFEVQLASFVGACRETIDSGNQD